MLTPFGKTVRKMRIDLGITLKSMAESMDMTSSYLSAIETGKRAVTNQILENIIKFFQASGDVKEKLIKAADESHQTVEISLLGRQERARDVAIAFARNFDDLSAEDLSRLQSILNKNE